MVAYKVAEWKNDPKMKKYLRPETLFNATKFESYIADCGPIRQPPCERCLQLKGGTNGAVLNRANVGSRYCEDCQMFYRHIQERQVSAQEG